MTKETAIIERMHTNPRMSRIVKHTGIDYLCGPVGDDAGVIEQTQDCLARIDALLTEAGSSCRRISQAVISLADMVNDHAMNAVQDPWEREDHAPPRACSEARLADADLMIEIIIKAAEDAIRER